MFMCRKQVKPRMLFMPNILYCSPDHIWIYNFDVTKIKQQIANTVNININCPAR